AFAAAYRDSYDVGEAVTDIAYVEAVLISGVLGYRLYRRDGAAPNQLRFKLYGPGDRLPLSDVLPMLENMGLKVMDEIPHRVMPESADFAVWIHDFGLVIQSGATVDIKTSRPLFEEAFARVWHGEAENDGFNKLVLGAGLSARKIVMLRGYCKFLLQTAIPFSQAYMEETLVLHPGITRMITDLFQALLDPAADGHAAQRAGQLRSRIQTALDGVSSLDEDRILRRFLNAVECTLRTNYFQHDDDGETKSYVSFKLDSSALEELPLPRPQVEVFVHSPRVDAVHLRGGPIARGGIRWSDRREDFRTEVLGLMKSQMPKNAVIVPVGAKGGFVVKQPPVEGGRDAMLREGIDCYKTFMRGLLDITDNLESGKVAPPPDVVRRDDDDPYLVVAADKGTATFSDIANEVSREYGFWLDDAFASGGSAGYDHKTMGITARGAWESVKRHFREMGIDVMNTDFTAVGVGDMSGDVFGNGMIYTPHVQLIGAFNHLHIFVDPNPDAARSFRERKRLFDRPRSSWSDYDAKLISRGGGIFDRSAKSIKISPQMRAAFPALTRDAMPPNELILAMLRAPVDLMWFGGIGTYIKATGESNVEVGDRGNESIRVNGREITARVIGEGANLGVTQLGRCEYALGGGRINTDFIDNSAGVDCSDHEVNIKILLGEAVNRKKLTRARRDKVLSDMTDDVAALVLTDNYRQSMALTHAEHQSFALIDEHQQFMHTLERGGKLDRAVEFLPSDEELDQRRAGGGGLSRPELSVLLAYAKIVLFENVLNSALPDDPYLVNGLDLYFPPLIQKRFADLIPAHRLRREIIATYVANTLVNRTGPGFVATLYDRTGAAAGNIARAYLICRQVFRVAELWAGVEALDNSVPADIQTEMHLEILEIIKLGTMWFLRHGGAESQIDTMVRVFHDPVAAVEGMLADILADSLKSVGEEKAQRYIDNGVPAALARRVANLDALAPSCDIVRISAGGNIEPIAVARLFYELGRNFGFDWLRDSAFKVVRADRWARSAARGLVDDLYAYQAGLTTRLLDLAGSPELVPAMMGAWSESHGHAIARVNSMIGELKTAKTVDLPMLMVVGSEIRALSQL
ncbi:MAG: NAD-glutamate dehydrogenase domain-containing protein, partial [Alphaproteobacteria bacterium]